jgi:hypothetical protein
MKAGLFIFAIVAYLCSAFYPSEALQWILSACSLCIVLSVFLNVKGYVRGLGSIFLCAGLILYIDSNLPWASVFLGFGNMLNILSLFAIIPLIALPIQLGRYDERVQEMIQRNVKHSRTLYAITSFLSFVFSSFMNVATFPMMYHLIRPSLDLFPIQKKDRFISRAITHGFAMPTLWTPVTPIVGIIMEMTGVRWSTILPIVIPFSLLGLALDIFMGGLIAKRRRGQIAPDAWREVSAARENLSTVTVHKEKPSNPIHILIAILAFNGFIYMLERTTDLSFILIVSMSVVPFALLWSLFIGKGKAFLQRSKHAIPQHLLKMKDQFFVFLSAGFMISSIQASGAGHTINEWIYWFKLTVGTEVFLILIPLIPLGLAFIGLHPAVALALTAESLNPAALGISVELTAIAMLIGASTSFLMGPYNATIGLMSTLVNQTNYRISNWNAPFTAIYMVLGMSLLLLLLKNGG